MRDTSIEILEVKPIDKLKQHFEQLSKKIRRKKKLQTELDEFVKEHKDNEVLKEYLKKMNQLEEITNIINDKDGFKSDLYIDLLECNEKELEDKYCKVNLVSPYDKTVFKLDQFILDYKPGSKLYDKYVEKQLVKGHVKITEL